MDHKVNGNFDKSKTVKLTDLRTKIWQKYSDVLDSDKFGCVYHGNIPFKGEQAHTMLLEVPYEIFFVCSFALSFCPLTFAPSISPILFHAHFSLLIFVNISTIFVNGLMEKEPFSDKHLQG